MEPSKKVILKAISSQEALSDETTQENASNTTK